MIFKYVLFNFDNFSILTITFRAPCNIHILFTNKVVENTEGKKTVS